MEKKSFFKLDIVLVDNSIEENTRQFSTDNPLL